MNNKRKEKQMKNKKSKQNNNSTIQNTPYRRALPQTGPPVEQMVANFLTSKSGACRREYIRLLNRSLRPITSALGRLPARAVTSAEVRHIVFRPGNSLWMQKRILDSTKNLFNWGCQQNYLSHSPINGLGVCVLRNPPTILTPAELKTLLVGANDCECRLYLAISAFTGIRPAELAGLSWQNINPTTDIFISGQHVGPHRRLRKIAIIPALDAWLQPFYSCHGRVVDAKRVLPKLSRTAKSLGIRLESHKLRRSHIVHRLALAESFVQIAAELGCRFQIHQRHLINLATPAQAREFFSLTPAAVGIGNWSEIVFTHLRAAAQRRTPSQHCGLAALTIA